MTRINEGYKLHLTSFNPHTHAGCDCSSYIYISFSFCFNPHTHAGCDFVLYVDLWLWLVSIHTPTQGVTWDSSLQCFYCRVSIHTPTQGVTPECVFQWMTDVSFNPHTHAGCDNTYTWLIHFWEFQSTHPRRVWLQVPIHCSMLKGFNPHTHAGCDGI